MPLCRLLAPALLVAVAVTGCSDPAPTNRASATSPPRAVETEIPEAEPVPAAGASKRAGYLQEIQKFCTEFGGAYTAFSTVGLGDGEGDAMRMVTIELLWTMTSPGDDLTEADTAAGERLQEAASAIKRGVLDIVAISEYAGIYETNPADDPRWQPAHATIATNVDAVDEVARSAFGIASCSGR